MNFLLIIIYYFSAHKNIPPNDTAPIHAHGPAHISQVKSKYRNDDLYTINKSPFDRTTSNISKFRRELLMMKIKLWPGNANLISPTQRTIVHIGAGTIPPSNITSQQTLAKNQSFNSNIYPRWLIHEEFALIMVLLYLQDLPFNLSIIFPGHIPNWDFVAEQVNNFSSYIRSSKFCKFHFESVIAAKDDHRFIATENDSISKSSLQNLLSTKQMKLNKKNKNNQQSVLPQQNIQPNMFMSPTSQSMTINPIINGPLMGTGLQTPKATLNSSALPPTTQPLIRISNVLQNMVTDNNLEFTNEMNRRFDAIKQIVIQKTQTSKSRFKKPQPKSFDHISLLLNDFEINYDKPLSVEEIAANRAERISKDKQAAREQQREMNQINQIKAQLINSHPSTASPVGHLANSNIPSISSISAVSGSTNSSHIHQQPSPKVIISQVSAPTNTSVGHIQSQAQITPQILINQVSASPQLQHVLTTKKLQNINTDSSKVLSDLASSMATPNSNTGQKILNSQIVNMQPGSQNVQHVTISQAQSMGLLGQSSASLSEIQQQTDITLPSTLQQHRQSQQQSTQQQNASFIQANHMAQQIPVSVLSTNTNPPLQQKLLALASGATVTQSLTQSSLAELISSGRVTQNQFSPAQIRLLQMKKLPQQHLTQQQLQQQALPGIQMAPRQIQMQAIRAQGSTQASIQRYQITSSNLTLNQPLISSANIKPTIMTSTISTTSSVANSQSHASIIGTSRILTSSTPQNHHVIASSVPGSMITPNKVANSTPIITRTIRSDGNLSLHPQLHGNVVQSTLASSNSITTLPITRNIQLLQKRPPSPIQASSAVSSQQVLMHKAMVQQSTTGHSIVVSEGNSSQQTQSGTSSSANIITPLLQNSSSSVLSKSAFQLMPNTSLVQPQSGPITVTKLSGSPSVAMQQMQQALKQGQIIMQQPGPAGGQVTQPVNVSNKNVKIKLTPNSLGIGALGIRLGPDKIILNAAGHPAENSHHNNSMNTSNNNNHS